jgi:hypothetical protein
VDERAAAYLKRVEALAPRLAELARPLAGLTDPDGQSGEQWDVLQVWGHVTEFVPYWFEQIEEVIDDYRGEPVPFGRVRTDPGRLAGIDSGATMPMETHLHWLEVHLDDLRGFLRALRPDSFACMGWHQKLGPLTMEVMIEDFLIGHLEEHATQLEALA